MEKLRRPPSSLSPLPSSLPTSLLPSSPGMDRLRQRNRHRVSHTSRYQRHRVWPQPAHTTGLPTVFVVAVAEAAVLPTAPAKHLSMLGIERVCTATGRVSCCTEVL